MADDAVGWAPPESNRLWRQDLTTKDDVLAHICAASMSVLHKTKPYIALLEYVGTVLECVGLHLFLGVASEYIPRYYTVDLRISKSSPNAQVS